jgi:outer membrane protein assembly factor BamE (lipoprotein component of BamABCDE complex)
MKEAAANSEEMAMKIKQLFGRRAADVCTCWVFVCFSCMGCAGVGPLPRRTHTPQGTEENVHLDFLRVGQTRREDVREKLKAFDTGVQSERYFVGRWTSSTWAWFAVAQGGGAGDRHWSTTNLLIEFDENGVVKKFESFPDKDLSRELGPVAEEPKSTEAAERVELAVEASYLDSTPSSKIILDGGKLEFVSVGPRKRPAHFTVGAEKVSGVSSTAGAERDIAYCPQVISFSESLAPLGGPKGKKVFVRIKVPDLVTLLHYIHETGASQRAHASG